MLRAAIVSVCVFGVVGLGACADPARLELPRPLPLQLTSLAPLPLPTPTVYDADGRTLDVATEVTVSPLGLAELRDGALVPRARGDITLTWRTANDKTLVVPIALRPIDRVEVRCVPSCRIPVGGSAGIQATAYSGTTPQLDVDVKVRSLDAAVFDVKDGRVIAVAAGAGTLEGRVGDYAATASVEVRALPDGIEFACPTIFTKTSVGDGEEMDVCYVTQGSSLDFAAHALAGKDPAPDARVVYDILNRDIADVGATGTVLARKAGQTTLKASLASDALVFKQVSIYVDEPRAFDRFWRSRPYGRYWSYYSGSSYEFYAPSCREMTAFRTVAWARVPDRQEPARITCESTEAVVCAAEAANALRGNGRASAETLRAWLGPCCCVTDQDREALELENARSRSGR